MKVVEILKITSEVLKVMSQNGVLRDDWKYVDSYETYHRMRTLGVKHSEAIRTLAKEKNVGFRTLERAFKRLSKEC